MKLSTASPYNPLPDGGAEGWFLFQKCQNLSQKIYFTAAEQSGVKNGRFGPLPSPRPMKNRGTEGENLHTSPTFVHVFCSNFAPLRIIVSTPNFQKSTPNFQKSLTFFSERSPIFTKKSNQLADNQPFSKPSKNAHFFVQKFFRGKFSKYGGLKWPFCQYLSKKISWLVFSWSLHAAHKEK